MISRRVEQNYEPFEYVVPSSVEEACAVLTVGTAWRRPWRVEPICLCR